MTKSSCIVRSVLVLSVGVWISVVLHLHGGQPLALGYSQGPSSAVVAPPTPTTNRARPVLFLFDEQASRLNNDSFVVRPVLNIDHFLERWGTETEYRELLETVVSSQSSNLLSNNDTIHVDSSLLPTPTNSSRIVVLPRSVPKTASKSLKYAIRTHNDRYCGTTFRQDEMAFNYFSWNSTKVTDLVSTCTDASYFWMENYRTCNPLDPNPLVVRCRQSTVDHRRDEFRNTYFVSTVPFRQYGQWAKSAFDQIAKHATNLTDQCNKIDERIDQCRGWQELNFYRYPKLVVKMVLGQIQQHEEKRQRISNRSRESDGDGSGSGSGRHILILYPFQDINLFLSRLEQTFRLPSSIRELMHTPRNAYHSNGTCDTEILQRFHTCFDNLLRGV